MFKKKDTKQLTKHDILADIEEKARTRYFQDVEKLRYPTSVLSGQNYTQIMKEKLYKYGDTITPTFKDLITIIC